MPEAEDKAERPPLILPTGLYGIPKSIGVLYSMIVVLTGLFLIPSAVTVLDCDTIMLSMIINTFYSNMKVAE